MANGSGATPGGARRERERRQLPGLHPGPERLNGGTSASTPLWAALIALVNQGIGGRAGLLQTILYALPAALNDVTTGDNGAYSAGPVWDACTGLGSPKGTAILLGYRAVRQVANILILQLLVETIGLAGFEAAGFSATDAASFRAFHELPGYGSPDLHRQLPRASPRLRHSTSAVLLPPAIPRRPGC